MNNNQDFIKVWQKKISAEVKLNDDDENLKSIDKNQEKELLNNIEEINDLMNNINENEKKQERLMIYAIILFLVGQALIIGGLVSIMVK